MAENVTCCACSEGLTEQEMLSQLDELIGEYIDKPGGLIPALQIAQGRFGYLSEGVLKKISAATGETLGWLGGITSAPTGGVTGCLGANPLSASPGWCLGAWMNPSYLWDVLISRVVSGLLQGGSGECGARGSAVGAALG
jgi:hypothetical protein